ncbi:MAG: CPBP family intramembrane glutamic endopeptidase [Vitreoscilla sp.]
MNLPLPFALLALAILLVWVPALRVGALSVPPWTLAFAAACACALTSSPQVLDAGAFAALAALVALAWGAVAAPRGRPLLATAATVLALAMSVHLVPGFRPVTLVHDLRLTPDASPFSLAPNFDKPAAGLVLLAAFCLRATSWRQFGSQALAILVTALATCAVAIGIALATGYVRFEPKWPAVTLAFLLTNLLFTCVAEEAFFRGLIQERLMRLAEARGQAAWKWGAIAASTLLFGLAHVGGGPAWMLAATVAGLGYAVIYARTRTTEGAILVHFAVNAAHFVGFTYPRLAG